MATKRQSIDVVDLAQRLFPHYLGKLSPNEAAEAASCAIDAAQAFAAEYESRSASD